MNLYIISAREGQFICPDRLRVERLLGIEERVVGTGANTERVYILLVEELLVGAVENYVRHLA